jgi:folylpolyglutamate synthase/dihydropteroate synthase
MRDKAVAEMSEILFPLAYRVIVTAPANSRAMLPESIPASGAVITHTVAEAVAQLGHAQPTDAIFITGSLFVVVEARALLIQ